MSSPKELIDNFLKNRIPNWRILDQKNISGIISLNILLIEEIILDIEERTVRALEYVDKGKFNIIIPKRQRISIHKEFYPIVEEFKRLLDKEWIYPEDLLRYAKDPEFIMESLENDLDILHELKKTISSLII